MTAAIAENLLATPARARMISGFTSSVVAIKERKP
jgi:hypothetical protein